MMHSVTQMLNGNQGFAPVVTTVEFPEGIQLLSLSVLLLVFAVTIATDNESGQKSQKDDNDSGQNSQRDAAETPEDSKVQLLRPDAIAFRSGLVTGFIGFLKVLPSSPPQGFVLDTTSLESLEGIQFLSVSLLLLIFALAVKEEKQSEAVETSKVELLSVDAIAFRSALAAGVLGLVKTYGNTDAMIELAGACRQNFVSSAAVVEVEASEGIQFFCVSLLLLIFALAVSEDASERSETESDFRLVRTNAIAFRFAIATALLGSLKTFGVLWTAIAQFLPSSPPQGFAPAVVSIEVPEGIQLLAVSVLLLLFAVLVISEVEDSKDDLHEAGDEKVSQVELVCAESIAFRAAIATSFVGLIKVLPASPVQGFNPAEVELEAPEGIQFLCISVLLLLFALAIRSDEQEEKSEVQLVKLDTLAFRSALFAGILGVIKTFGNPHARAELASLNQTEFVPDVAQVEAPEGLQLLCVALLLFVFVAAVNSEDASDEQCKSESNDKKMLSLVRPQTIAFRMAMVAALIGSLMVVDGDVVTLPKLAATGEVALVLVTGIAVMVSEVPRQLVSV